MATSPRRWAGVLGLVLAACGAPAEQPPPDAAPPIDTPPPPPDGDLDGVADADDCAPGDDTRWRTLSLFAEVDNDGVGAGGPSLQCIGATLPPMTSQLGTDCAAGDPARWRLLPYGFGDGDGATIVATGSACSGATLPPPYRTTAAGLDCDDDDPNLTRWVLTYPDLDGDGVGAAPRSIQCLGASLPPGRRLGGYDEDDADPAVITTEDSDDDELDLILLD